MQSDVRIVELRDPSGFQQRVGLQDLVWGHGPDEAVPAHPRIASARNGEVVLGDAMVGCLYRRIVMIQGRRDR